MACEVNDMIVYSLTVDPEPFISQRNWWIQRDCKLLNSYSFPYKHFCLCQNVSESAYVSVHRHVKALKRLQEVSVFSPNVYLWFLQLTNRKQ